MEEAIKEQRWKFIAARVGESDVRCMKRAKEITSAFSGYSASFRVSFETDKGQIKVFDPEHQCS